MVWNERSSGKKKVGSTTLEKLDKDYHMKRLERHFICSKRIKWSNGPGTL